jgi:hypothetical protein
LGIGCGECSNIKWEKPRILTRITSRLLRRYKKAVLGKPPRLTGVEYVLVFLVESGLVYFVVMVCLYHVVIPP